MKMFERAHVQINRNRLVGTVLLLVLLALFLSLNRAPKLDVVKEDLAAVARPAARCFQGFCLDADPDASFVSRWWQFSLTYFNLVTVGMGFAFVMSGLMEVFFLSGANKAPMPVGAVKGSLRGLLVGTPMTLCSACIVPISVTFRKAGRTLSETVAIAQASSTTNVPAVLMAAMVFTPVLAGIRIVLGIVSVFLAGPLVAWAAGERRSALRLGQDVLAAGQVDERSWREFAADSSRQWAASSARNLLRFGPIMIVAGLASGLAIQWIRPGIVESFLGDDLLGIAAAATLGILINVPLMFEIPLVAALLLLGMGSAPAVTLLFTAAAAGPITFMGLSRVMPARAVGVLAITTWLIGAAGGIAMLVLSSSIFGSASLEHQGIKRIDTLVYDEAVLHPDSLSSSSRPVKFTDVTESAGLIYQQYSLRPEGSCLLGAQGTTPFGGAGPGEFCLPERSSGAAAAADYDNDGLVDLFVTRLDGTDVLFRNRGDGTFEDTSTESGISEFDLRSNGALWLDVDNDSDMDLYVSTIAEKRFYLFINDGSGRFTEEAVDRGTAVETPYDHSGFSIAAGDYDLDGWLDLHITEWGSAPLLGEGVLSHARLLRNRGLDAPGYFTDVTIDAGVVLDDIESKSAELMPVVAGNDPTKGPFAFASAFVDLDADDLADLAIVSDFGHTRLFWNNGDGTFTDGTLSARIGTEKNGMGSTFGDYDGDGDLDWFVSSINITSETCESSMYGCGTFDLPGNRLYRNEGERLFSDVTDEAQVRDGGWGWGAVFFDYDNDGDLDLAMVGGMHHPGVVGGSELEYPRLWENDGTGTMQEVALEIGLNRAGSGKGVITLDYDRDGDQDLFIVNNGGTPRLYRNDGGNENAWLRVHLVGSETNQPGIGAKVSVTPLQGGPTQVREYGVRSHFLGQSELTEHFGLSDDVERVDEITIRWPVSNTLQVLEDVPANVTIIVLEDEEGFYIDARDS